MIEFAVIVEKRGTCKRARVGAIIANLELTRVLAFGYNGNYRGGPNTCDMSGEGKCGCVHAETNALLKAPYVPRRSVLITTVAPCVTCAKLIANAQIWAVIYLRKYRDDSGLALLQSIGVHVYQWEEL